jgi:hypothetical protein
VSFAAPDAKDQNERWTPATCKVEVSNELVARAGRDLRQGADALVSGLLAGDGNVLATSLHLGADADVSNLPGEVGERGQQGVGV